MEFTVLLFRQDLSLEKLNFWGFFLQLDKTGFGEASKNDRDSAFYSIVEKNKTSYVSRVYKCSIFLGQILKKFLLKFASFKNRVAKKRLRK
jgi:hypothetical protein